MKEYRITIKQQPEKIHVEKMSAEQLYRKLAEGFNELYVPKHEKRLSIMHKEG